MIGAYLTIAVVCGIGISYVSLIHCFWLRYVFSTATESGPLGAKQISFRSPGFTNDLPARRTGNDSPYRKRIIILGGGFSGVKCARELSRALSPAQAEIILFNLENHLVFTPLLAEVIGSSVNPLDVVVPLRQLLPGVHCRTEEVANIDPVQSQVEFLSPDGQKCHLSYDHLVLACGNVANLNAVPGMADHAFPLKNIGDAIALRSHVMEQMEKAETCANPDRRRWYLSFIIVGAGFSGVEAAGEINDLVRESARYFQNFRASDVTVTLIHSRDQILPEIGPGLRDFARRKMEQAGIRIILNARASSASAEGVALAGGEFLPGGTIVCTVGSSPSPILERLTAPSEKGRLRTESDMRVRGFANLWATGDCAQIVNAHDGQMSPPTGQFAERQGRQCAQNIVKSVRGLPTRPFSFKPVGQLCAIGGHSAVAEIFGFHLSGLLAWLLWRGIYLFKLPAWRRRFQVGFDWVWLLLFPRDLAHLRARQTNRVASAHYRPGDLILHQGDTSANFFVIESGEVEIFSSDSNHQFELLNVLGPGSFFGEKTLISSAPLTYSVRARTPVKVLAMGRNVITQISQTLAPLRDAIAETLNRRSLDVPRIHPKIFDLLKRTRVIDVMDAVPEPVFKPSSTMAEIGRAFAAHHHELFYICDESGALEGVVTMTDWLRALSRGARPETLIQEAMTPHPISVSAEDDGSVAAAVLREHHLKNLPIISARSNGKLVGCLRVRRLMAYIFNNVGAPIAQAS